MPNIPVSARSDLLFLFLTVMVSVFKVTEAVGMPGQIKR